MKIFRQDCRHGSFYFAGWYETGGLFTHDFHPLLKPVRQAGHVSADEVVHDQEVCEHDCEAYAYEVHAAPCTHVVWHHRNLFDGVVEHTVVCGAFTEKILGTLGEDDDNVATVTEWECPEGHTFETEDC